MTEFCLNLLTPYLTAAFIIMYTSIDGIIMRLSITNNFTLCGSTSYPKINKHNYYRSRRNVTRCFALWKQENNVIIFRSERNKDLSILIVDTNIKICCIVIFFSFNLVLYDLYTSYKLTYMSVTCTSLYDLYAISAVQTPGFSPLAPATGKTPALAENFKLQ